jgi:coproporphyrinogen III oxidase-like Fe-S oxidoreductase
MWRIQPGLHAGFENKQEVEILPSRELVTKRVDWFQYSCLKKTKNKQKKKRKKEKGEKKKEKGIWAWTHV